MDCEAEATIARSYYKFQNGLMIMPKIIPYGNKTINDYKREPKSKIINDVERTIMKEGIKYTEIDRYVYIDPKTKEDKIIDWLTCTEYIEIIDGVMYEKKSYSFCDAIFTTNLSAEAIEKAKPEGLYYEYPPKSDLDNNPDLVLYLS